MTAGATAGPVRDYLRQIGKVALLNVEQEVELAKRIDGAHRQTFGHDPLMPDMRWLIHQSQADLFSQLPLEGFQGRLGRRCRLRLPCERWSKAVARRDRPLRAGDRTPGPAGPRRFGCPLRSPQRPQNSSPALCSLTPSELANPWAMNSLASTVLGSAGSGGCCTRSTKPRR
jgi:hypothetical protein